jgi:hypothetical protein
MRKDFVPQRKHTNLNVVNFWDIAPYSPYVNRRFGGTCHHFWGKRNQLSKLGHI